MTSRFVHSPDDNYHKLTAWIQGWSLWTPLRKLMADDSSSSGSSSLDGDEVSNSSNLSPLATSDLVNRTMNIELAELVRILLREDSWKETCLVPERKYSSLSVKVRDGNEEESLAPFADCRQENEDNSVSTIDRTLRVEETQGAQVDDESPESFGKTAITSNEQEEPAEETSAEERILELYNRLHPEAELEMSQGGSSFHGFVRIQMNLVRPISVAAGARPPSLYDLLGSTGLTLDPNVPRVSFFLPRDTVRSIHVSSETTSRELIAALLRKFLVVDDPRKFALYEKCWEVGQTTKAHLRRLADDEKPLRLCLMWSTNQKAGSQQSQRFLVLQENEIGDIPWEHFELPELNNFLRMLDREEEMYKMQLREKYRFLAYRLQELMQSKRPAGS